MGGGSGGGGDSRQEIRFAPYIEEEHKAFLALVSTSRDRALLDNPFESYEDVDVADAFFGLGYNISSFPSMYDMYGKFMAGLDIDALWDQNFNEVINGAGTSDLVTAEAALYDDDIAQNVLPKFKTGYRDINAVMSSSFVIGESLIYDGRNKSVAKFSAELKYKLFPLINDKWKTHLTWNQTVITTYAEIMKLYYSAKMDIDEHNYKYTTQSILWPFTVLEYQRAALGAMQGATNANATPAGGASKGQKAIGGALSGAAMGATIGSVVPGIGTAIGAAGGAVLGGAAGYFS